MTKKTSLIGIIGALIGISVFIVFLNTGNHAPIAQWPIEAYWGVTFTIGWLTRMPDWLVELLAVAVFAVLGIVCYLVSIGLYRSLKKQ